MARDGERERPDADFVVVGDAAPAPGFVRKMFEQEYGCAADRFVLLNDFAQRDVVEIRVCREGILIEAGQFGAIVACEPQGAVRENSLGISNVPDQFLDTPFAGGVPVISF